MDKKNKIKILMISAIIIIIFLLLLKSNFLQEINNKSESNKNELNKLKVEKFPVKKEGKCPLNKNVSTNYADMINKMRVK